MTIPFVESIDEDTFGVYTTTLLDEDSTAIALASIVSITMTLIEESGGAIVNSREAQDVLNTNNCTMHATSGLFTWEIQKEDTDITLEGTAIGNREKHLATITVVWNTAKQMHREIRLRVMNMNKVPQ